MLRCSGLPQCQHSLPTSLRRPFCLAPLQHRAPKHSHRHSLVTRALTSNDIRPGTVVVIDKAPWRVVEFLHVKPGKGAAFVRSKLKNYLTGSNLEKTFRAGEPLEGAIVEKRDTQYTYLDGNQYVFMDMETYEEQRLVKDESWAKWLTEGMNVQLVIWEGKVISVDVPKSVELVITQSEPGVKGNTAAGGSKPATLETGAVIQVPLFVNQGEKVRVDTREGTYLSRASS
ncbi:hypothetical protein WJX74_009834 [Apatococcus lobatus]|uniref:Elongation factor P n=1 Tax=Apatococcus lobatus TaxID=904363 RepID=A0AAW1S897_9CHLO